MWFPHKRGFISSAFFSGLIRIISLIYLQHSDVTEDIVFVCFFCYRACSFFQYLYFLTWTNSMEAYSPERWVKHVKLGVGFKLPQRCLYRTWKFRRIHSLLHIIIKNELWTFMVILSAFLIFWNSFFGGFFYHQFDKEWSRCLLEKFSVLHLLLLGRAILPAPEKVEAHDKNPWKVQIGLFWGWFGSLQ